MAVLSAMVITRESQILRRDLSKMGEDIRSQEFPLRYTVEIAPSSKGIQRESVAKRSPVATDASNQERQSSNGNKKGDDIRQNQQQYPLRYTVEIVNMSSSSENKSVAKRKTDTTPADMSNASSKANTANKQESEPTQPKPEPNTAPIKHVIKRNSDGTLPRLINDGTLEWNETMHRPWLDDSNGSDPPPPFMILLTNVGWNHPNPTIGLAMPRALRERELMEGIVNHPYFHPTAWEAIRKGDMPVPSNTRVYVFADVIQCKEKNYPNYGNFEANLDAWHNRSVDGNALRTKMDKCSRRKDFGIWKHPVFAKKTATLVVFNCNGDGPHCPQIYDDIPISMVAIGGKFPHMDPKLDQGMIPPAPNPIQLSAEEEEAIASCSADKDPHSRPVKLAYVGNVRDGKNRAFHEKHGGARQAYLPFHNPEEGIFVMEKRDLRALEKFKNLKFPIRLTLRDNNNNNSTNSSSNTTIAIDNDIHMLENPTYDSLLRSTKFALAPRGDDKFSYRFTEVLSAGAIPVYHGDDHVLPFRPELVDWNKCGLVLPEKDAGQVGIDAMMEHLANTPEARAKLCAMRQYCYFEVYKKYVETPTKQIDGMVQGLEQAALARKSAQGSPKRVGTVCNETTIENLDCNPIR